MSVRAKHGVRHAKTSSIEGLCVNERSGRMVARLPQGGALSPAGQGASSARLQAAGRAPVQQGRAERVFAGCARAGHVAAARCAETRAQGALRAPIAAGSTGEVAFASR
jgi:hypothetical protein